MAYFLSNWDNNGSPPRETHIPATATRYNSGRSKAARAGPEPSFPPGLGREPAPIAAETPSWKGRSQPTLPPHHVTREPAFSLPPSLRLSTSFINVRFPSQRAKVKVRMRSRDSRFLPPPKSSSHCFNERGHLVGDLDFPIKYRIADQIQTGPAFSFSLFPPESKDAHCFIYNCFLCPHLPGKHPEGRWKVSGTEFHGTGKLRVIPALSSDSLATDL